MLARYVRHEDVIGGQLINSAGLTTPSSTLPYGTPSASWSATDIPDQFRTTLTVQFDSINQKLFTDEIAGQRLQLLGTTQGGNATTTWVDSNGANNFLIPRLLDDLGVAMTSRPTL